MRLLIVDDSRVIQKSIQRLVAGIEMEVVGAASNGVEALQLLGDLSPELVTLDITMPEMDGLACLQEIIKKAPACRVLIISALNDVATGLKALRLGASGYLNKPFTEKELLTEIKRISEMD